MLRLVQRHSRVMCLAIVVTVPFLPRQPAEATICPGDCDGSGSVAINELIVGVNVALGSASLCDCSSVDSNFDDTVMINELVAAVNHALLGCPLASVLHVSGTCARQPSSGGRRFVACDDCTAVRVYSCEARDGACLQRDTSILPLAAVRVSGGNGGWALDIPSDAVSPRALLSFEAEVDDGVIYRTLDLGPAGSSITVAATRGVAEVEDILISPATEAAVRLIEDSGLQNFSDDEIAAVSTAVDAATAQIPFADLSAPEAATQAEQTASQDPTVITIIENAVATATPATTPTVTNTLTPTSSVTASETPTVTATPSETGTQTQTPTITPTSTPICRTTIQEGLVVGETWTVEGSPYCITSDLAVSLLTIQAGVEVLVDGPHEIEVLSTIVALGDDTARIRFSSKNHTATWKGFRFQNTPPGSRFEHTIIERSDRSALTLRQASSVDIVHCIIRNNSTEGNGGAVDASLVPSGELRITDSIFEDNTANPQSASGGHVGGAIYLSAGNATITRTKFVGNRVIDYCTAVLSCQSVAYGGAIYVAVDGAVTIANSTFTDNGASASQSVSCGCACLGNATVSRGGAVFAAGGSVLLRNSILSCNQVVASGCGAAAGGTGLYVGDGSVSLENVVVARNLDGSSIDRSAGDLQIVNSIIYFNSNNSQSVAGVPLITFSDVQGGFPGEGNIDFHPAFAGPLCEVADFRLVIGSPAIDKGNDNFVFDDACFPPSLGTILNDMGAFGGPGACNFVQP